MKDEAWISLVEKWLRSTCQCRGHGFNPWSGKIPHTAEQLSSCATAAKPVCINPMLCNQRNHCSEKPVLCATREIHNHSKDLAQTNINKF